MKSINYDQMIQQEIIHLEQMVAKHNEVSVLLRELKEGILQRRGRISILEEMKQALPSEGDADEE